MARIKKTYDESEEMKESEAADKTFKARVYVPALNIRDAVSGDAIGMYFKDDVVEVLNVKGEWYETAHGWIRAEFVEKV